MDYQIILYVVAIAVLFLFVQRNNKSNKSKFYDRKGRNFRENFKEKRKATQEEKNKTSQ